MLSKFTHPYTGSVLLIQRPTEARAFAAAQPRLLPPPYQPALSRKVLVLAVRLALIMAVLLALAVAFFLFGEERPERGRPALTPAQRAQAFRIHSHE